MIWLIINSLKSNYIVTVVNPYKSVSLVKMNAFTTPLTLLDLQRTMEAQKCISVGVNQVDQKTSVTLSGKHMVLHCFVLNMQEGKKKPTAAMAKLHLKPYKSLITCGCCETGEVFFLKLEETNYHKFFTDPRKYRGSVIAIVRPFVRELFWGKAKVISSHYVPVLQTLTDYYGKTITADY